MPRGATMGDVPRLPTSSFALLLTATLHATMCATPCAQDAATGAPSPPPPTELRYGDAGRPAGRARSITTCSRPTGGS